MAGKQEKPEDMVLKQRQVDVLHAQGKSVSDRRSAAKGLVRPAVVVEVHLFPETGAGLRSGLQSMQVNALVFRCAVLRFSVRHRRSMKMLSR
ncbi:hypothetical protein PANO111632_18860 [Paracoccus nototheniae]